jgi:DNA-directed RNA polymerase specialized sigma24 family protein
MKLIRTALPADSSPQSVFAAKYEWLLKWAMHFAQGERSIAEDLVQDTFVRFVLYCPEVKDPENAEPLLYTYLKYVHLAHLRRLQRYPHEQLSPVEFDSLEIGLRANPSADLIEMQDELRRIITYLAWRKETAKSASILILRFLHGYYPDEIMRIGLLRRPRVDNSLAAARDEVRRHLENPGKILSLDAQALLRSMPKHSAVPADRLIDELRAILFESRRGECLPLELLRERYREEDEPLSCSMLAHIVSCQRCLDAAGRLRDLPPSSEQNPDKSSSTSRREKSSLRRVSRNNGLSEVLKAGQKRVREVMEHHPRRLTVVINGHVFAAQNVTSVESQLEVEVASSVTLELIEVISEQGLCLMAMPVSAMPPEHPPEIARRVELSAGRSIEVRLSFTSVCPQIWVAYSDPTWQAYFVEAAGDRDEIVGASEYAAPVRQNVAGILERITARWRRQKAEVRDLLISHMNPTFVTAVVLAIASIVCFAIWYSQRPIVTPAAFIQNALMWDSGMQRAVRPGVVYQKVAIRTRKQTIERTLYRDAQGLRRPKKRKLDRVEQDLSEQLAGAGVNWDEPLSVATYRDWHDHSGTAQDKVRRGSPGSLTLTTSMASGPVAQESLTVRENDFHPLGRTVEFRGGETVEIAELNNDVLPWGAINQDWFEPLPGSSDVGMQSVHPVILGHLPVRLTDMQLDEAELGARLVLSQLHLDADARVQMVRSSDSVQVEGIVSNIAQRRELESRMHQVKYVTLLVTSEEELRNQPASIGDIVSVKQSSDVAQVSPLETFLTAQGMHQEDIVELSQRLLNASITVNQRSRILQDLSGRFGSEEHLNDASRRLLEELMKEQSSKLLSALDEENRAISATGISTAASPDAAKRSAGDLASLGEHNFWLCKQVASGGTPEDISVPALIAAIRKDILFLRATVLPWQQESPSLINSRSAEPQRSEN